MKFIKDTVRATFVKRPNRFQGFVEYEGEVIMTHVPNTGRVQEILLPGATVILRKEDNPARKTAFSLIAAYKGEALINIDSQIPNKVVEEALLCGHIPELRKYSIIQREKTYNKSRFDFLLESPEGEKFYLEVKGVTLEEKGRASFPDAPTERGTKHINELMDAYDEGYGAGVLFVLQMANMKEFSPAYEKDPLFSSTLYKASQHGVMVMAYECKVTEHSLDLTQPVPVRFREEG
ncbi:DNA/RNA nuclease SfsA [Proteiniclasticum sp. SCR006]|uniref:Sugar fermentation stimulation protein homolog n=1 Tax=Proteiniclasticum aestuarii TaxID=2817862 RepID=A0A939H9Q9_9CLOT|nr:DNA/RNA nuclease SfsA [Proteiniclasticum aestuarii]MBO1264543.1 DNA/RNA nuclease SfsA [Proteiniclasticum aestuarii]